MILLGRKRKEKNTDLIEESICPCGCYLENFIVEMHDPVVDYDLQ